MTFIHTIGMVALIDNFKKANLKCGFFILNYHSGTFTAIF
jgi:hypothetical protein